MIDLNNLNLLSAKDTIKRIVKAYGLKNMAELSKFFDKSAGTVANRVMRNTFPFDYVVRCAMETGASLEWLVTGKGEVCLTTSPHRHLTNSNEILSNLNAKDAIKRIVKAYGLKNMAELSKLLDTSAGTIANRVMRNTFPFDYVVKCALETGVSLEWLIAGKGEMCATTSPKRSVANSHDLTETNIIQNSNLFSVESCTLEDGILTESANLITDKSLLIDKIKNPLIVIGDRQTYITEREFIKFTNGKWLVTIGQNTGVYELAYADDDHVIVSGGEYIPSREFKLDTLKLIARVKVTCIYER